MMKQHLKTVIRIIIEGDANPATIAIRLSKAQLFKVLDYLIPDDVEVTTKPK